MNTSHTTAALPPWIAPKDVAAHLGVSERTVIRLCRSGDLKGRRIGKRLLRIDRNSVLKMTGEA
ncbi:DNA-binding protein [Mycolicibacterium sp. CH28]|uniref:helix-turn-helix domain-containing protein n=1 Tax=Mycolicibacterium sp. CH28 TaxID=2512237 RepID=UPI00108129A8|nr:helix-turn-helix domain-containing protein [Mycolicibacterium sp. CH28]TGD85142.1 DNA-binding protein [Mycolicibacterium sp. CH28]